MMAYPSFGDFRFEQPSAEHTPERLAYNQMTPHFRN